MDKIKINDFVDVWAATIGLTDQRYISLIKNDIIKRCLKYEEKVSQIKTEDDYSDVYIIKPINNAYSLEDFFLNRLMLGLREISFGPALEGNAGEYVANQKSLCVDVDKLNSHINDKSLRHKNLMGKNVQIIEKTIEHEIGHCLKTKFNDGFLAPFGGGREQDVLYENLIRNLHTYQNGKYSGMIRSLSDIKNNEYSDNVKTGINDPDVNYNGYRLSLVDELLNEQEALELTNSDDIQEIWPLQDKDGRDSKTGNYIKVRNYLSGYSTFTSYGNILKALIGEEDTFFAEYISSKEILNRFNIEYADIVNEVWNLDGNKYKPIFCLQLDFDDLLYKKFFDEEIVLKLDEFMAKCYEKKINKILDGKTDIDQQIYSEIFNEITTFKDKMTTNDDETKLKDLGHIRVFARIEEKIKKLYNKSEEKEESFDFSNSEINNTENEKQTQSSMKTDNNPGKIIFSNALIEKYDLLENDYQLEKRIENEENDIFRVKQIIDTQGLNKMLISDLIDTRIVKDKDGNDKFQYTQKQVFALVRLLKASKELDSNLGNLQDDNSFYRKLIDVPQINYMLKQLYEDRKDENSYIYEMEVEVKRIADMERNSNKHR